MQLADPNSKPHGMKSFRDIIYQATGVFLYPPIVSEHYKIICLDSFHLSYHQQAYSHDKPTKKEWNLLYEYFKVYNVLHHDRAVKFHNKINPSHPNDYVHLTRLHDKRTSFFCLLTIVPYSPKKAYHPRSSFDILPTKLYIPQKSRLIITIYVYILVQN